MHPARSKSFRYTRILVAGVMLTACALLTIGCGDDDPTTPNDSGNTLLEYSFENFAVGDQSGPQSYTIDASEISGVWDAVSGGVEAFAGSNVSVTRRFGVFNGVETTPFLLFVTTASENIGHIKFTHWHNHNLTATRDGYNVIVQFNDGSGFRDLGTLVASAATSGASEDIPGPGQLAPGTYAIRWVPTDLGGTSSNTGTDFFAMDDVRLTTP